MPTYGRYEIGVGALVVGATALLAWLAVQVGAISGYADTVTVTARLPDAAGLTEGAVVSVAGVQVGRVERLVAEFDEAVATVTLDEAAALRRDVRVAVRSRSVLGEKYLALTPVSRDAPLLVDGDTVGPVAGQVDIDEMVTRMGPLVEAVNPEDLRLLVHTVAEAVRADPERGARMLADAERLLKNLADASEGLPATLDEARGSLAAVRRAADAARPAVARLDDAVARMDALVAAVPPEQVPELLAEIEAAVKDGRATLEKLDGSSADLAELLAKLNGLDRMDLLRITQEEGVLVRLRPRKREDAAAKVPVDP